MENYLRHQKLPDSITIRQIFEKPTRSSAFQMDNLGNNVKAVVVSSHLRRTSTYQRYRVDFLGILSSMIWQTTSKAAIIARNIYQCQKNLKKNCRTLLFPQRWWNKLGLLFAIYQFGWIWMSHCLYRLLF